MSEPATNQVSAPTKPQERAYRKRSAGLLTPAGLSTNSYILPTRWYRWAFRLAAI